MSAPTLIPVGLYDTIEDQCLTLLKLFNTEQSPLQTPPGSHGFNVVSQFHIVDPINCIPGFVNFYCANVEPMDPQGRGSIAERVTFYADLRAIGTENPGIQAGSTNAHKNLLYLAQQVRWCLVRLANYDFGLGPGYISRRPAPSFTPMANETTEHEQQVEDGRITMNVEYAWVPEDLNSMALTEVMVKILGLLGTDQTPHTESQVPVDFTVAAGSLG